MRKIKIKLLVFCILMSTGAFAQNMNKLKSYLQSEGLERVSEQKFARKELKAKDVQEVEQILIEAWEKEIKEKHLFI